MMTEVGIYNVQARMPSHGDSVRSRGAQLMPSTGVVYKATRIFNVISSSPLLLTLT